MTMGRAARQQGDEVLWDDGLQPERTSLAWLRTGLGMVGVSLLLVREATRVSEWMIVGCLLAAIAAATFTWTRPAHVRRTQNLRHGRPVGSLAGVVAATAMVLALAGLGLTVALGSMTR
jgi:uncharacterized membrane protein YidH (DUF202 family)